GEPRGDPQRRLFHPRSGGQRARALHRPGEEVGAGPMTASRLVPLLLLAAMMAMEAYASRLRRAEAEQRDRGSFLVMYLLVGAGFFVALGLWGSGRAPGPRLGAWALWAGAAVTLAGVALRVWAIRTLGQYFTYVVKVTPDQKVVETGPYRLLRHPSYTGGLLTGVG